MSTQPSPGTRFPALAASLAAFALSGCAVSGLNSPGATPAELQLTGSVHGGQQSVAGATMQLYAVGTTATGATSTALIAGNVTTTAAGGFSIGGTYSCSNATQVYLVASGGNPGSGANPYSVMAAALGSCSDLLANAGTTFIQVNELTTIAAAYALAPFEGAAYTAIGANTAVAPGSVGLPNAFSTAALLVNTAAGAVNTAPPAGITLPTAELNTLADILASCVNSAGAASAACTQINTATGATNTFDAAFYIAKNPGSTNVTGLYTLATAAAPFQPTLTTAPRDFAVQVTYAGSTATPLSTPYGIAIDAGGNAFVTSQTGNTVTALSPLGTGLVTGQASAGLSSPTGIAIDTFYGYLWIANPGHNNVENYASLNGVGGVQGFANIPNRPVGGFGSAAGPMSIVTDQSGNAYTLSPADNTVYAMSGGGGALTGTLSNSSFTGAGAIALSAPGTVAVGNSAGQVCTFSTTVTGATPACATQGSAGSISALGYNTSLGTAGYAGLAPFLSGPTDYYAPGLGTSGNFIFSGTGAASAPAALAFSSAGKAFLTLPTGLAVMTGTNTLSPAGGYGTFNTPRGVAVDPSGNVWVTSSGDNTLAIFVGLAAPTLTPIAANLH